MRLFAPWVLVLLSAAISVGAYLQAIDYSFVADDTAYITLNTRLSGLQLTELWRLFIEPFNGFAEFLPLRDFSYWFDMALFGQNPVAFRLHNIILYLLCLPMVYAVTSGLWRYFRPADAASASWAAAAVTALFALHPALVESVVWISGRKYMLPNLFAMIALWFAINAKREQGFFVPYAAAALVAFVAVMLSKASYVTLAPVIALLWILFWFDIPAPNRRRSQLLWPLAILLLAVLLVRVFISSSVGIEPFSFGIETITRALAVLGWLARLSVSPENRHYFYPVLEDPSLPAMIVLGTAVLVAAAAGAVMLLRKRSLEGFSLVVFVLLCLPYIQLLPYAPPSLVSDRFLSLAVWPVLMLLVALVWRLKPVHRTILLLVIALSWGFQTVERPRDWRNFAALLDVDLRAFPGFYMPAVYKITGAQLPQGLRRDAIDTANGITAPEVRDIMIGMIKVDHAVRVQAVATGNPQEAMDLLWQSGIDLKQQSVQANGKPLISNILKKRYIMLKDQWEYLAKEFPDDVSVRYNAGLWMLDSLDEGAAANLRAAIESKRLPENVRGTALKNYGFALICSGHVAEAETPLRAALEQSPPDFRAYCLLSEVYKQTGRISEAASAEAECNSRVPNSQVLK